MNLRSQEMDDLNVRNYSVGVYKESAFCGVSPCFRNFFSRIQLFKIVKNTNYGRSFFVKLFWDMKLMPIIDYACEIWTVELDKDIFKKIKELQVKYLREMYKLGKTSCIKSIFMESFSCKC